MCCGSWGLKESDTSEQLNRTELMIRIQQVPRKQLFLFSHSACLTVYDSMHCSLPGFSVYGILHARIVKWVAITSSRATSLPRVQTQVSFIAGRFLTTEPLLNPSPPHPQKITWVKNQQSSSLLYADSRFQFALGSTVKKDFE